MNIMLMFGPCHGMVLNMVDLNKDIMVSKAGQDVPTFSRSELREKPDWTLNASRRDMHRYTRYDEFSSINGEDCALYTHAERCCEMTSDGESQDAKPTVRIEGVDTRGSKKPPFTDQQMREALKDLLREINGD